MLDIKPSTPDEATLARWAANRERYRNAPPPPGALHPGSLTEPALEREMAAYVVHHETERTERQHERYRERGVVVAMYENELQVRHLPRDPNGCGTRGEVRGYSLASRRRLIGKLNRLRWSPDRNCHFVTLTYPDHFERDWKKVKRHFSMLRKRLLRRFADLGVIWRMELKRRKMGFNRGQVAPHFHCFVFTAASHVDVDAAVRAQWHDIAGNSDKHHVQHGTDVKAVSDRRGAQGYVSKYMSKEDDVETIAFGRQWGYYGLLDFTPTAEYVLSIGQYLILRRLLLDLCAAERPKSAEFLLELPSYLGFRLYGFGAENAPPALRAFLDRLADKVMF